MKRALNRGFTLIEMMIALSIFAALMAALMAGFSQGLSLWDRAQNKSSQWQALEYRYGLLASLFVQAQAATYTKEGGMYVPYYQGTSNSLRLMTRSPILDFPGRVRPVELVLQRQGDDTYSLIYKKADRYSDPARGIDWRNTSRQVLISDIKHAFFQHEASAFPLPPELDILYLDKREKIRYRDVAGWLEEFNSNWMWRLPQRVSFHFTDSDDFEHQWTFPLPTRSDAWTLEVYADD